MKSAEYIYHVEAVRIKKLKTIVSKALDITVRTDDGSEVNITLFALPGEDIKIETEGLTHETN